MFKLDVRADVREVERMLTDVQKKQVPFATSVAINATLREVKAALYKEMRVVFNNPSRFTLNSLQHSVSSKKNLNGFVWIKDGAEYILPHIFGGTRPLKRFEKRFAQGSIEGGEFRKVVNYAIPSPRIVGGRGKVSPGLYTKVLSGVGTHPDKASRSKKGTSNKKYFVATIKGTNGIWESTKKGVKPVFIFVPDVNYKKRFDFFGIAERTANRVFPQKFNDAINYALRTAK